MEEITYKLEFDPDAYVVRSNGNWLKSFPNEKDAREFAERVKEGLEPTSGIKLELIVSPWSGYSGVYVDSLMDEIETEIRKTLDERLGYLNDHTERTYTINRTEDWSSIE